MQIVRGKEKTQVQHTEVDPSSFSWTITQYHKALYYCDRLTQGRLWVLKVVVLATVASLFFAFPSYDSLEFESGRMADVAQQIESLPGFWQKEPVSSVAFRLTVPLAAQLLHIGLPGTLVLQFLAGIVLFYLLTKLAEQITGDRVATLLFTLGVAFIYAGSTAFVELRGIYDSVALCLLVAAMYLRAPVTIAAATFLASFTDERAFLASGLVILWWAVRDSSLDQLTFSSFFTSRSIAVLIGGFAYLAARLYIAYNYNIGTLVEKANDLHWLNQINNIPMGVWTAFEGGWLLIVLASIALYNKKTYLFLTPYVLMLLVLIAVAMSQVDITRSMAYLLPGLPLALHVLYIDSAKKLRFLVFVATTASFFWPAYYAGGKSTIWWNYPLPLQLFRWLFRI